MKNQPETSLLKASKKFDKELLHILSKEIKAFKNPKSGLITRLNARSSNPLLVA